MGTLRTDFGGDQLDTPEGFHYVPFVQVTRDDAGRVVDLVVGIRASHDDADPHDVSLIPSSETDEGDGHGNVFVYEDDDALTHVAWTTPTAAAAARADYSWGEVAERGHLCPASPGWAGPHIPDETTKPPTCAECGASLD